MNSFVEILSKARPTIFTGVNTLFGGLLMHPKIADVDFSSLRVAIGGGAAVLPTTSEKWKALTGKDILEGYGLSETSPVLTLNPMTMTGFSGTVGLPFHPRESSFLTPTKRKRRRARRAKTAPRVRKGWKAIC